MSLLQVLQWNYESRTFTCNGVLIYYLLHVIVLVLLLKQRIWMLLPLHMVNKKVHASHKGWLQLHVLIHSKLIRNTSHLMDNLRIMMIMAEEIAQSNKWWRLLCRNISAVYRGVVHHHYCNMFSRFVLQIGSNECELCVCVCERMVEWVIVNICLLISQLLHLCIKVKPLNKTNNIENQFLTSKLLHLDPDVQFHLPARLQTCAEKKEAIR